ncbi:MAG: hypothetical protein IJP74_13260 [Prevotella sp.]|nr:hypothetical protein [Prevotella sp.]
MAALLMASAAVFTACSSDDNITSEQPANPTGKYTMIVQASKGDDATTRALTLDETTSPHKLNATWNENEEVLVYQNGSQIGKLYSAASTTNETTLTGELSAPDAGQDLTLYFHTNATPSYAGQDGTLATIASTYDFCAPATITAGSFKVSDNTVSTTGSVSFGVNQQAIVKFTLIDKADGTTLLSATKLVINDGTTDYTITPASNTSVIYAAIPGFTSKTVKLTATVGNKTYTYEKASQSFTNGQYYEITVKMTEKPDLLSGVFSVSSTKKVKFSKGNLRYASGTWSFFDFQNDYYTSYSADAWDKFCWSTSATTYGMNTSTSSSTYSGNFVDWGATMGTGWFTLSSAEWTYLFNTRSASTVGGTSNGRYAKAKVNGVWGVILFPNTYTHPDGVTAPTGVNAAGDTGWNGNNYSSADWTKMESAGCVFLPGAGYRSGSSVYSPGIFGGYWSATPNGADAAYGLYYYSGYLDPAWNYSRNHGLSVRLVQVTE